MIEQNSNLGKLESVHGIAPAYLQRAVIIAVLSFLFFLATLAAFYARQNIGYFLLSTAFLIVYIFTMFGWIVLRKNVLKIYENGLSYKKFSATFDELEPILPKGKNSYEFSKRNGEKIILTETISDIENIVRKIDAKIISEKTIIK